jgi:carbon starvation protein
MNAGIVLAFAIAVFIIAYRTYGNYVAGVVELDDSNTTPAYSLNDGIDYVPAQTPVLFGHHFATIAGAGPIVGPILAIYFGWLPAFLWIIFGTIFIGAVHDFLSLTASMRHQGRSIGSIIEQYIGKSGKKLFLLFSFPALVLVIAVFMSVVVKTFVAKPEVGTASVLFVFLALGFGYARKRLNIALLPATIGGLVFMAACIWGGMAWPMILSKWTWTAIVAGYIFFAAIAPVSMLLQPRDYLNSYLLLGVMLMAIFGVFVYHPDLRMPAFTSFSVNGSLMFPILFVTVACGAVSGFHSLAASGTTSKQVVRETAAKPIGYGSMLVESVLAVVALISVAYLAPSAYADMKASGPIAIFSNGVGTFSSKLGIPISAGITFAAMAISSFALTTLDSCVRLARYAFQEFFSSSAEELEKIFWVRNPITGTTIAVAGGLLLSTSGGASVIWPVFGAANQLLGALALLATAVWLEKTGRESLFAKIPMWIMFAVSLSALVVLTVNTVKSGNWILAFLSIALFGLGVALAVQAHRSLKRHRITREYAITERETAEAPPPCC